VLERRRMVVRREWLKKHIDKQHMDKHDSTWTNMASTWTSTWGTAHGQAWAAHGQAAHGQAHTSTHTQHMD
jgi:hypothetical protein